MFKQEKQTHITNTIFWANIKWLYLNELNFPYSVQANFEDDEDEADDGYDQELERRRKEFQKRERLEKAGKLPQVWTFSLLVLEVHVF